MADIKTLEIGYLNVPHSKTGDKMRKIILNQGFASNKVFKKVSYKEIRPISDGLAYYQGKMYGTKEDLKYYPKNVRLVKFGDFKRGVTK